MLNYIANYYNFCRTSFFVYYTQQISAWLFGGAFAGAVAIGNPTVAALSFVALLLCFPAHVFHRGLLKWSTLNYFALLMVSLAWDVRRQSSERLTKDLLRKLHVMMHLYTERHKRVPQVTAFIERASDAGPATGAATGEGQREVGKGEPVGRGAVRSGGAIPVRTGEDELPDEASLLTAPARRAPRGAGTQAG